MPEQDARRYLHDEAQALSAVAEESLRRGDTQAAAASLQRAARIARALDDDHLLLAFLTRLATALQLGGCAMGRRRALLEEAALVARQCRTGRGIALVDAMRADVALDRGDFAEALLLARSTLPFWVTDGDRRPIVAVLQTCAGALCGLGAYEDALQVFATAESLRDAWDAPEKSPQLAARDERFRSLARAALAEPGITHAFLPLTLDAAVTYVLRHGIANPVQA